MRKRGIFNCGLKQRAEDGGRKTELRIRIAKIKMQNAKIRKEENYGQEQGVSKS
jgi:hypothetical protein